MNPDQIRALMGQVTAKLTSFEGVENYTPEQIDSINALHEEFEGLEGQLKAAEKMQAMKARSTETVRETKAAAPAVQAATRVEVIRDSTTRYGGFKSVGDFYSAVKNYGQTGTRAPQFNNFMYEKSGEDGGFQVPEEVSTTIMDRLRTEPDSLWSKANVVPISGNAMRMPTDESQPWSGGIQAYWTAEGEVIPESKPKFGDVSLRLHKLAAMVKPTDELLEDAPALEAYINRYAPVAIMWKVNSAMYDGNGVGKPQGVLNSPFTLTIPAEAGQPADTVVPRNIINMYSHLLPAARAGAAWYVNPGVIPSLMTMKDDNGNFIYLGAGTSINQGPFSTLMGLPVIPMMSVLNPVGDRGDILLANFDYYTGIEKSGGVKNASSIHLHFDRMVTSFRFSLRLDGRVPFSAPITTEKGGFQMSAFVVLADRP